MANDVRGTPLLSQLAIKNRRILQKLLLFSDRTRCPHARASSSRPTQWNVKHQIFIYSGAYTKKVESQPKHNSVKVSRRSNQIMYAKNIEGERKRVLQRTMISAIDLSQVRTDVTSCLISSPMSAPETARPWSNRATSLYSSRIDALLRRPERSFPPHTMRWPLAVTTSRT